MDLIVVPPSPLLIRVPWQTHNLREERQVIPPIVELCVAGRSQASHWLPQIFRISSFDSSDHRSNAPLVDLRSRLPLSDRQRACSVSTYLLRHAAVLTCLGQVDAKDKGKTVNRNILAAFLLIGAALSSVAGYAWAQQTDEFLSIEQPVDRDLYAAHRGEVNVLAAVGGDLVAAGRDITLKGKVRGDVIAAAQNVEVLSAIGDDLRAAGQHIRVTAPVAGHIVAAGQSVTVSQGAGDWAWLAGNTVEVLGDIGGDLRIRAREITINANIEGNAQLVGNELQLGPKAKIRGDLRWFGDNEADISPEATISGELIEQPSRDIVEEIGAGGGFSFTLSFAVATMALFLLFSGPLRASANRIASNPFAALALGVAVAIGMPVLALLLVFSPLSAWIGVAVLGSYFVILFLSILAGLFAVSDLVLRKARPNPHVWQALVAIFLTVLAVGLLTYVPWVGSITVAAIWLLGVGALCWDTWIALRTN